MPKTRFSKNKGRALSKKVENNEKRLDKLTKESFKKVQYQIGETDNNGIHEPNWDHITYSEGVLSYPLVCPKFDAGPPMSHGWKNVFESSRHPSNSSDPDNQYKFNMSGIQHQFHIEIETGTNRTQPNMFQVFVVSLKKAMRRQTLLQTANLASLREGLEYTTCKLGQLEFNAMWKLNPEVFDIHYNTGPKMLGIHPFFGAQEHSEIPELVTPGNYVTKISDVTKSFKNYTPWRKTIVARPSNDGATITGFKDLTADQIADASQLYVVAFTNAIGPQVELPGNTISFSANHTVYGKVMN